MVESKSGESKFWWNTRAYTEVHERSLKNSDEFWAEEARKLTWDKTWDKVLDWDPPFAKWFKGGVLNASVQCVDRHAQGPNKNKVAIYFEGEPGDTRVLSYATLYREVNRAAASLKKLGIKKGDRVIVYLPMIPELPIFLLACARIGAPHSVVFSGFSASALADRVNDTGARMVITADGGWRRGKVFALKPVVDQALETCPTVEKVLVVKRGGNAIQMKAGRDIWAEEAMKDVPSYVAPEPVESTHPLFILYTSGTTGKPKGIVHSTGGYMTYAHSVFNWVFNPSKETIYWCTADVGWVTGHTFIVYGPLAAGETEVMYEGAPDFPNIERWWDIIEKYKVTTLYTSPTAIRMFMAQGESYLKKHDLSSLKLLGSVGESINPEAWHWYFKNIGGERCPIVDTWWQTETGAILISGAPGISMVPMKPSSATLALPGVDADVVGDDGKPTPAGQRGYIVVKRPWPGMMLTIYGDPERFKQTYWSRFPGWYYPADYAIRDEDGYFWFLGRADEVLKVAGHRIGTLEIENATVEHPAVAEAAAVGRPDPIKGDAIVVFAILRTGNSPSDELKKSVRDHIRKTMGPVATPEEIHFVAKLPKTRSGKIMRRVLRAVASNATVGDVTTLEDSASVDEVKKAFEELRKAM